MERKSRGKLCNQQDIIIIIIIISSSSSSSSSGWDNHPNFFFSITDFYQLKIERKKFIIEMFIIT